jgi:hypothetical protein
MGTDFGKLVLLRSDIEETMNTEYGSAQCDRFIRAAEAKIYGFLKDHPALRKDYSALSQATNVITLDNSEEYTIEDIISVKQHIQDDATASSADADKTTTRRKFLLPKEPDFLLEAFPEPTVTVGGTTNSEYRYYSFDKVTNSPTSPPIHSKVRIVLAPEYTNNTASFTIEARVKPKSITDVYGDSSALSYLTDAYYQAVLYGALVAAHVYNKSEPDMLAAAQNEFTAFMAQLNEDMAGINNDGYRPKAAAARPIMPPQG